MFPKDRSADHAWSAKVLQMVREIFFCPKTTNISLHEQIFVDLKLTHKVGQVILWSAGKNFCRFKSVTQKSLENTDLIKQTLHCFSNVRLSITQF